MVKTAAEGMKNDYRCRSFACINARLYFSISVKSETSTCRIIKQMLDNSVGKVNITPPQYTTTTRYTHSLSQCTVRKFYYTILLRFLYTIRHKDFRIRGNTMKLKSLFMAAVIAASTSTAAFAQNTANTPRSDKRKTLVVYFSRADENYSVGTITEGNTAILAKMIAAKTGADVFEIVPEKAYPKQYRACTDIAKQEQRDKARPAYKGDIDVSSYDTIYIGYPIWWGDMPMVVYTFLEKHDLNGKTIIPFCTHEGSGLSGTDNTFRRHYKTATVKEALAMRGSTAQNRRSETEKAVDEWLK